MILYECGWFYFDETMMIAILLLIIGAIVFYLAKKRKDTRLWFWRVWYGFAIFFFTVVMLSALIMTITINWRYKRGDYLTVEGCVEDFHPMPWTGHDKESFVIDGVYFEYSDYEASPVYNNTLSHGGVVNGNGQYLKIRYIQRGTDKHNSICYIEQLRD